MYKNKSVLPYLSMILISKLFSTHSYALQGLLRKQASSRIRAQTLPQVHHQPAGKFSNNVAFSQEHISPSGKFLQGAPTIALVVGAVYLDYEATKRQFQLQQDEMDLLIMLEVQNNNNW